MIAKDESDSKIKSLLDLTKYLGLDKSQLDSVIGICESNNISFLGLFGSYSRGEQNEDSDIDLLVNFSKRKSLLDHIRIERNISEVFGMKVDLVTEKYLSPYFADKVKSEVRTLYHD